MIVTLTHAAGQAVCNRVNDFHREKLLRYRRPYGRSQHHYTMPFIGWCQVREQIERQAYGPNGGKRADQPRSLYTAIAAINEAIGERENHPALTGSALQGVHADMIPVWWDFDVQAGWSPTPYGQEYALLVPTCRFYYGSMITEWHATSHPEQWDEWPLREVDSTQFVGL